MKQRLFSSLFFILIFSGCGGVTPYPNLHETPISTTVPFPTTVSHLGLEPITTENIHRLEQIDQYGDGNIYGIAVSPDKHTIAVHTPKGIYLYDSLTLTQKELIAKSAPVSAIPNGRFPLAFSPDGKLLAFSVGWIVYIYDLSANQYTDRPIFSVIPDWNISEIAFSPDGQRILLTTTGGSRRCDGGGGNFALYDFDSHLLFDRYFCTAYAKNYYRFTQDGKLYLFFVSIMTSVLPMELYAIDVETGKLFESSLYDVNLQDRDPKRNFYDVSFDGKILATAKCQDGACQTTFLDSITHEELSQTSGLIMFIYSDNNPSAWKPIRSMYSQLGEMDFIFYEKCDGHSGFSDAIELSEDKVVVYRNSIVEIVDLPTCKVENSTQYYSSERIVFSPNSRFLAATTNGSIFVWEITNGKPELEISGNLFDEVDNVISFNADGSLFLTGKLGGENIYPDQPNRNYIVSVWDIQAGEKIREISPSTEFLDRIMPTPDKNVVVIEDASGLNFWNVQTGKLLVTVPAHVFEFTEDGNHVWVSVIDQVGNRFKGIDDIQVLTLYDYHTGKILQKLDPLNFWVKYLYLNETETKMALHFQINVPDKAPDDVIRIIDLISKETIWEIQWNILTNPFERLPKYDDWDDYGFSKEFYLWQKGEILAGHGFDLYTKSWHFQSEKPYSIIPAGDLTGNSEIVVTRNNSLPYSYQKEIVQFWSAKTGNLLGEIRTYYKITNIAFSPDGYLIAVSGDDGIIRIWGIKKTD